METQTVKLSELKRGAMFMFFPNSQVFQLQKEWHGTFAVNTLTQNRQQLNPFSIETTFVYPVNEQT